MSSVNITIPLPKNDAKLLMKEAKKQNRTFSGYIQKILNDHLEKQTPAIEVIPKRRKKVIIKRKKVIIKRR